MEDICFILQARLGSSRLPNKVVLPFYDGQNILEILVSKLKHSYPEKKVIIATSTDSRNDVLVDVAANLNCEIYRGSESDVLQRMSEAAEKFGFEKLIRVCPDNPFLDMNEMSRLLQAVETDDSYDYVSFQIDSNPVIKTHFGFWAEYVTVEALQKVMANTEDMLFREHVTNFIYQNPEYFKIKFLDAPTILEGRNDIRLTLDTFEDFKNLSYLYSELSGKSNADFTIDEIVSYLDSNRDLKTSMRNQIELNSK